MADMISSHASSSSRISVGHAEKEVGGKSHVNSFSTHTQNQNADGNADQNADLSGAQNNNCRSISIQCTDELDELNQLNEFDELDGRDFILAGYKHSRLTLNVLIGIAAVCNWLFGSLEGLGEKMMDNTEVPTCSGCEPAHFKDPWIQNLMMCIAEGSALLIFFVMQFCRKHYGGLWIFDTPVTAEWESRPKCPWYMWFLPSMGDIVCCVSGSYAVYFVRVSTVTILGNFQVLLAAGLTMLSAKRALTIHQWIGTVIVTGGIMLASVYECINPDEETNTSSKWAGIGYILAVLSGVAQVYQMLIEEWLFRKYKVTAMQGIGTEGCVGLITSGILILIVHVSGFMDEKIGFYQIFHSGHLAGASILTMISIAGNNIGGVHVTRLGTAVLRTIVQAFKTPLQWTVEVIFGMNSFDWWTFSGVLVTVTGVLMYINYLGLQWCMPTFDSWLSTPLTCCCGDKLSTDMYNITCPEDRGEEWISKNSSAAETRAEEIRDNRSQCQCQRDQRDSESERDSERF